MRSGAVLLLCIAGTTAFPAAAQPAPADRTAPGAGASRYAGTWQGRILTQARDSQLVTWTWVEGPDGTGSLTFGEEMTSFPTREHPVPVDSLRFELLRPLDGPDSTVLRFVGLARGDSISGIVSVRIRDGRTGRRRFEGRRVGPAPVFERSHCMFPRGEALPADIECGWLVAPESRSRPLVAQVRLAVMIRRTAAPNPGPPIVFLHGGPGNRAVPTRGPTGPPPRRTTVYVDQRASGYSQPALCPEFNDSIEVNQHLITRQNPEIRRSWIRACVDSLRTRGIDPEAYNSSTSAHDFADLRRALGYRQWVLHGGSYGTRLAQEVMRLDPLGVHSAVLIAPLVPGQDNALEWRLRLQGTLQRLFAACSADSACHQAFPDPEGDLHVLFDTLSREPVRVPAVNGRDTVVLHGDRLITGLTNLLDGAEIRRVPLLLHELRRGDRMRAARIVAPRLDPQAGGVARALNRLVNCYEAPAIPQGQADSADLLPLRPFRIRVDPGECTLWRTRFATEAERTPVRSDIPTLILAGEYDARTPVENGRRIAQTLTRGYVFELPGMTHGSRPRCLTEIMTRFLEDPDREPDASCIGRMPKLTFSTAWPP